MIYGDVVILDVYELQPRATYLLSIMMRIICT